MKGREIARFTAVAVLTGAPWYVYNAIWTGNPISPFAGEWFGTWPWTAEDLARQVGHLTKKGHDPSLTEFLSLPWYLLSETWRFGVSPVSVPVLLVPGLVALALLPWWDRCMRPYGVLVLVIVTVWFFTASYFRYLTAILPLWCLVSAWTVERVLWPVVSLATQRWLAPDSARKLAAYVAAMVVLVLSQYHFLRDIRWLGTDAVTERVVNRERYLRNMLPVYGVAEHLRRARVRGEVILVFPPGPLLTYVRDNRVVGDHFGPMGRGQTFNRYSLCKDRLVETLRQEGVSRLVLLRRFLERQPDWGTYLAARLITEYTDRHAIVYRIDAGAEPLHTSRQQGSADSRHGRAPGMASPAPSHATIREDGARVIPFLPVVSGGGFPRGFARIVNHSDVPGTVVIHGTDDAGTVYGPTALELEARQTRHLDTDSIAACTVVDDAAGRPDRAGAESWRLSLDSDLDIEVLAYIRTEDGFVASMHEVAGTTRNASGETVHEVPFFNPGGDHSQASHLRLINPGRRDIEVMVAGRDDAGVPAEEAIRVLLPRGTACRLSAWEIESGASGDDQSTCKIVAGGFGVGQGNWRLSVNATGGDIQVMNLLVNPTGHLTNLSASVGVGSGDHALPLVLPATDSDRKLRGFVRIVNGSGEAGKVAIHGIDDNGVSHGPIELELNAYEAVHLDSRDLEAGNVSKGLSGGLGDGAGYWRLTLATELDIDTFAHVRTADGFVTSMHPVAGAVRSSDGVVHHVPYFELGTKVRGNRSRFASSLRLVNRGAGDAEIEVAARNRGGAEAPGGVARLALPGGQACMLSARELETGKPEPGPGRCASDHFGFDGRFGDAAGVWSLFVTTRGGDIQVMSLLASPAGYMANVSAAGRRQAR